jgi:hypothetical protein
MSDGDYFRVYRDPNQNISAVKAPKVISGVMAARDSGVAVL